MRLAPMLLQRPTALAWTLRQPTVSSVIAGATRANQVDDNAGAAKVELTGEVVSAINAVLDTGTGGTLSTVQSP